MKGYKAFNKDLTCKGMQYKVGEIFEMDENPICCKRGFHFCKNIADVYNFYEASDNTRICEVEALGNIVTDDDVKYCTNKIKIIKEIHSKAIKHCNVDKTDVGYCNSGHFNSGYYNSGNFNSGHFNSGYYNSGNRNSGNRNSGNRNSGNYNSGNYNSGYYNSGNYNSGNYNSGYYNSGYYNSGNHNSGNHNSGYYNSGYYNSGESNSGESNSGNHNSGYYNSGYYNSGESNSGNHNSGNFNSGDYNSGDYNSGYCNTNIPKVRMFNQQTDMDFTDERLTKFKYIMSSMPQHSYVYSDFIPESNMSEEEKESHPEYKTIGGYIKTISVEGNKWKWWNEEVSEWDKEFIRSLPYYDEDIFFESTGIKEDMNK